MKRVWYLIVSICLMTIYLEARVSIIDISPKNPSKRCTQPVTITGKIHYNRPDLYSYYFIFSDGVRTQKRMITFSEYGTVVKAVRKLPKNFVGWVKLIASDTRGHKEISPPVKLENHCPPRRVTKAMIKALSIEQTTPKEMQCPGYVTVKGTITTNGAVTVRYRFQRKDGIASPIQSTRFENAGAHHLRYSWKVRKDVDTAVRLELLAPTTAHTAYVRLKAHCKNREKALPVAPKSLIDGLSLQDRLFTAEKCPSDITVQGKLHHAAKVQLRVRFVRADGVKSPWIYRTYNREGVDTFQHTWRINGTLKTRYRMEVQAKRSGAPIQQNWRNYTTSWHELKFECHHSNLDPVKTLSLKAIVPSANDCPSSVEFSGQIVLKRAARVQYRFLRSDGYLSKIRTLTAHQPGIYPVRYRWELRSSLKEGWVQLKILSPFQRRSYKAHFKLNCTPMRERPHTPGKGHKRSELFPALIFPIVAGVIANATQNRIVVTTNTSSSNTPTNTTHTSPLSCFKT